MSAVGFATAVEARCVTGAAFIPRISSTFGYKKIQLRARPPCRLLEITLKKQTSKQSNKPEKCGPYTNDRTGNPNAVVNARQKKVNTDYHSRAKSLDARGGDTRDGFEAELNSYGQGGRVLGPVVGAFAEMSDDVKELANAVAEELAVEHCSFYGVK